MISKYIRYGISLALTLAMFVLGTAFHKLDTIAGSVIDEQTQVLTLTADTEKTGIVIYVILFALTIVAGYFGRRAHGFIVSALISYALGLCRVVAALAVISVKSNIIMFDNKGLQFMQLGLVLAAVISTFVFAKKSD